MASNLLTKLTKSNYIAGLQCPKYLSILVHDREKIPAPKGSNQYLFDQGIAIGNLAKRLFPSGFNIPTDDFKRSIRQTTELIQQRRLLFEASVISGNLYSRIDILKPTGEEAWDIIEVKSTTSIKDIHLHDISFQKFCCEQAGLVIRKCFLMYVNNKYIRSGPIDPEGFFSTEDITASVDIISTGIQERINVMFSILSSPECPDVTIGEHCNDPYECPLKDHCWRYLPENNVFELYRGGKNSLELFRKGVLSIKDIPNDFKLTDSQKIQKSQVLDGEPHIDKTRVRQFLDLLKYPLHYLDFETISPAIPLFDGTRPYQPVPFQFSLHIARREDSPPEHHSFIVKNAEDPRLEVLTELHKVIGNDGSIIVYNQSFEERILNELGKAFPNYDSWVNDVRSRLIDLLVPFRKFHFYHPSQKGSISIKNVLPAITGASYKGMDISGGMEASIAFQSVTYSKVPVEERGKVISCLESYCRLDTEGMIWIISKLRETST